MWPMQPHGDAPEGVRAYRLVSLCLTDFDGYCDSVRHNQISEDPFVRSPSLVATSSLVARFPGRRTTREKNLNKCFVCLEPYVRSFTCLDMTEGESAQTLKLGKPVAVHGTSGSHGTTAPLSPPPARRPFPSQRTGRRGSGLSP